VQFARVITANHDGESVVEAQRTAYGKIKFFLICDLHPLVNIGLIAARLLLENGSQRRARVFRINIDSAAQYRLLANKSARQIETSFDRKVGAIFDDLREEFSEHKLFGEVFGSNYDTILAPSTGCDWKDEGPHECQRKAVAKKS
jgi:hypothetical protein